MVADHEFAFRDNMFVLKSSSPRHQEQMIPLRHISYMEIDRTPRAWGWLLLTVLAVIGIILGFGTLDSEGGLIAAVIGVLVGGLGVAGYLMSGGIRLEVRSASGKITMTSTGQKTTGLEEILKEIQSRIP